MEINRLSLAGFRNYLQAEASFSPGINVISGQNAQGKTNLLEAAYLLSGGRSFRTRLDREMVGFDAQDAEVSALVSAAGREQKLKILLRRGARKQITRNGVKAGAAELADTVKAVLFSPEDLNLIRDGPALRRRLLDMAISQLRPGYPAILSDFSKFYESKSRILRDYRDDPAMLATLPSFSDGLCRASARIIRYRASYAARLAAAAAPIHWEFSGGSEELQLSYRTVSTVSDPLASEQEIYGCLLEHLRSHEQAELASGQCLTGAHKDDLEFTLNGRNARSFASQGQTRTAALSVKLAEREIVFAEWGEYPVLLLDDVLSELDARRQEFVLRRISGGQTLITCCEDERIVRRTGGRVLMVDAGQIRAL